MRHYELIEDRARKFWEISLCGSTVTVRFGRLGTRGQRREWSFASPEEAKLDSEERIRKKTKKGYQLTFVEGVDAAPVDRDSPSPLATNEELFAHVHENVDDPRRFAVLGDWLQEQSDPRGPLIALQVASADVKDPSRFLELKRHGEKIIADSGVALAGALIEELKRALAVVHATSHEDQERYENSGE